MNNYFIKIVFLSIFLVFCNINYAQKAIPTDFDTYKNTKIILEDGKGYYHKKSYINAYNRSQEAYDDAVIYGYKDLKDEAFNLMNTSRLLWKQDLFFSVDSAMNNSNFVDAKYYLETALDNIGQDDDIQTKIKTLEIKISEYNSLVIKPIVLFYEHKYDLCVLEFDRLLSRMCLSENENTIYLKAKNNLSITH